MTARVHRSHGELRAETPRPRDLPATPDTAVTAPDRDPASGRFVPGNRAARRRAVKRGLRWLDPDRCEPWARPYLEAARGHATDLIAEHGGLGALVSPLAEELACARLVARALLQLGLAGDRDALEAARAWLREARQLALVFEGLARGAAEDARKQPTDPHARVLEAFGAPVQPKPSAARERMDARLDGIAERLRTAPTPPTEDGA